VIGGSHLKKQLKSASKEKDASKEAFDFSQQLQFSPFDFPVNSTFLTFLLKEIKASFALLNEGTVNHPSQEIEHPPC
jgi:hypothetical protein